ncbi:TerD family protein [Streptomyces sp. NPDC055299]
MGAADHLRGPGGLPRRRGRAGLLRRGLPLPRRPGEPGRIRAPPGRRAEQSLAVRPGALPAAGRKVVIAAAVDGIRTFGEVGALQITAGCGSSALPLAQSALDAATTERTLLLTELYRRGPRRRFRAVGQSNDHGLDVLARGYGVDVEE